MRTFLTSITICVLAFGSSYSQNLQNTWGFGVGVVTGGTSIQVPIMLEKIRLEPELSFRTGSNTSAYNDYYVTSPPYS